MTLEDLFRHFTDEEFQYNRFLKTRNFEYELLEKYHLLFEAIKSFTIHLELNEELCSELSNLDPLDLHFSPEIKFFRKVIGFLTFGVSTKRYIRSQRSSYYLQELQTRHRYVQAIQLTLRNE